MSEAVDPSTNNEPRSSRVGLVLSSDSPSPSYEPGSPPRSPPLPARSPLRPPPPPRANDEQPPLLEPLPMPLAMIQNRSFGSFANLLDSFIVSPELMGDAYDPAPVPPRTPSPTPSVDKPEKPLPLAPEPSIGGSTLVNEPRASTSSEPAAAAAKPISKRTHALLELLSSERAYASDLALIRDIHIPLALGEQAPFPITPPQSSSSSERTLSMASGSSTGSTLGPPMTREDTRLIFSNVSELALFSDAFSERLEDALGCVLEGGKGDDYVGEVFLEMIPHMEPPYKTYITRHPTAVEHLNKLPQTPALQAYLSRTRELAASLTHAWDLPSLLIKPVQRLLKYSLLLNAIIEETPDVHPDKENLRKAKQMMERVSHSVNEGQRRREIVKEVLTSGKTSAAELLKKKGLTLAVSASVSFGRVKGKPAMSKAENEEAEQVARMEKQMKDTETFMQTFAKEAVDWSKTRSSACRRRLAPRHSMPSCTSSTLGSSPSVPTWRPSSKTSFYPNSRSSSTPSPSPSPLLEAMHSFEPYHHTLLNHNVSKGRPAPALLEASTSYIALRGQLHAELPAYLALLRRGTALATQQVATWQARFWQDVRALWSELWDALRVEGEMNAGSGETERVWRLRWAEVERDMAAIAILRTPPPRSVAAKRPSTASAKTVATVRTETVASMLGSLEPVHMSTSPIADSFTSFRSRAGTGASSSISTESVPRRNGLTRRPSEESLRSIRSAKSGRSSTKSSRPGQDIDEWSPIDASCSTSRPTNPPRRKSMPIPLRKSSSSGKLLDGLARTPIYEPENEHEQDGAHGRPGRAASLRQNMMETLRPSISRRSSSRSRKNRSGAPEYDPVPPYAPASSQSQSHSQVVSPKWRHARTLYACRVIHECQPPDGVAYFGLPFFRLELGAVFGILREAGHPSTHRDLPLYVDDGDDCLLLARDERGEIGWVLASFLYPVD
ncbi:hypothetical protein EVG20_g4872 [Dentipellis fragilis]|uniref:DH domain-containing protein n=1 Tax=Dentipellis fragilis TaxID=205917 RepID=A0A4Y9YWU6_9AGAM|nr:hypothetical protein EVG20_g4872 [Dentipellis fragilis]